TTPNPLAIEVDRAEGVYLYGPDGKEYMDMISGISVSNVGHCHPQVVQALQEQSAKFMHLMVYGEYVYSPQTKLAEALIEVLPESLDNFYFTNSGTEATEGAFKLAKRYTGRAEIISCFQSYHGSTAGALSAMGDETYQTAFRPLVPGHSHIRYNTVEDLTNITESTAAVIIELISAEKGVVIGNYDYFQLLRKRCTEVGCLLIFDEIQTGCGRTGTMFAFEQYDVIPDILLIGKGFGGGMPIAAFIANKEVMRTLSFDPILGHISTYGGNAVCCAAALACLGVLKENNLLTEVNVKGKGPANLLASFQSEKEKGTKNGDPVILINVKGEKLALGHYFEGSIAVRVLSFDGEQTIEDILKDKLEKAYSYRQQLGLVIDALTFRDTVVAAGIESGRTIRIVQQLSQPEDHPINLFHPESNYLKGL
ncbi:unnamed protein product, partial [Darwinula stevensoni]